MNEQEKIEWQKRWIETFANKPYRPSNGTEGMEFTDKFCANCIHEKFMHTQNHDDKQCEVFNNTLLNNDFSKWFYDDKGLPYCTCFKKWDWGFDDEGNSTNEPKPVIPDDPNQLCMPLFEIIEQSLIEIPELK